MTWHNSTYIYMCTWHFAYESAEGNTIHCLRHAHTGSNSNLPYRYLDYLAVAGILCAQRPTSSLRKPKVDDHDTWERIQSRWVGTNDPRKDLEWRQVKGVSSVLSFENTEKQAVRAEQNTCPDQHSQLLSLDIFHPRNPQCKRNGRKGEDSI